MRQIKCLGDLEEKEGVEVVKHDFDDHTLSIDLKKKGEVRVCEERSTSVATANTHHHYF